MECNKDEAKRAMDIAERKITEKDYNGAKKFANKAQNLFPHLDGLKHLLPIVDVYLSGEKKICGEADWYGILGLDPFADVAAVKRQYHKLVLVLHPDKNKCKGAKGAFNLVLEAYRILSDKKERNSYSNRRQVSQQRFPTTHSGIPPQQPTSNGFQNVREPVISTAGARSKHAARMNTSSIHSARMNTSSIHSARMNTSSIHSAFVSSTQEDSTFWTKCDKCKTQYEYLRVYLNHTLRCPNCLVGFVAEERPQPPNVPKSANISSNQQYRSSNNQAQSKTSYDTSGTEPGPSTNHNFHQDYLPKKAGSDSRNATNQAVKVVQQAQDRQKRGFWESQERDAARGFTNSDLRNFKRPKPGDTHMSGSAAGMWSHQIGVSRFSTPNFARGNTETLNNIASYHPYTQETLSSLYISKTLINKAQSHILETLQKMISEKEKETKGEKKIVKATSKMSSKANEIGGSVEKILVDSDEEKNDEVKTIVVPDSDFHNFDLDRSENSFGDDQIWAAYDDDDGMPRFYARIQKVISLNPFKMKISWLSSKNSSEFNSMDWIGSGFAKTCGDFRVGRYESTDALNAFSHKVDFTKGTRGLLHILPKKGQVWALYRNWSPEWDKNTPDEVKHKYEMVEVLDDYTEDEQSVTVALLLKAEGFRAVFRRSTDENDVKKIAKEEMLKFSHQVPHYILTGKEADNAPAGCFELDPAATPCGLLAENGEENGENGSIKEKSSIQEEEVCMDL